MIKIESIEVKQLKNNLKVLVRIKYERKIYSFFYKIDKICSIDKCMEKVDYLIPVLFNIWYYLWKNIDLNWFSISRDLLHNIKKIEKIYNNWYHKNTTINIQNYKLLTDTKQKITDNKKAIFFSLWVDSFYTLYKKKVKNLIFINWFDIRQKDKKLFNSVKYKFNKFCMKSNLNWIVVDTNIREFTERFYSWNFMFWSCLASVWLLLNDYNQYYISSRMDDNIWYPWWSHKDTDYLRWNWKAKFIHYWSGVSRSEKIKFISEYDEIYDFLRVCRKNYDYKYNCGICEKCVRTMLDFLKINKLNNFNVLPKYFDVKLLNNIDVTDANYLYYNNLLKDWNLNKKYLNIIQKKIKEYIPNKTRKKNKNIIFIDFNWVISYKNFWHSLEENDKQTYEKLNETLFSKNIQVVKDWMLWKYTSLDICKFISKETNVDCEYIYKTLIDDCKNIDLSDDIKKLLEKLKKYYKIILVTDNMDCFEYTVKNNKDYFNTFDSIFNSAEEWIFKVDAYLNYINKYNSQIELSYLIDDSLWNCTKFNDLWWKSLHVKWEKSVVKELKLLLRTAKNRWERQF